MSYDALFSMSSGLSKPIRVPAGTLADCQSHVASVEKTLGYETTLYLDNPKHWLARNKPKDGVTNEVFCETAMRHNHWVYWLYDRLEEWSKKKPEGKTEKLTPKDAATFWHGLEEIHVPVERWTRDYYQDRMEHLYEVMRGRANEGVTFDPKALTVKQAAAVICLFSEYLDAHDIRLDVPNGHDYLASSYDGGYVWCEKCGPVHPDEEECCRKRGCPLRAEREAEENR